MFWVDPAWVPWSQFLSTFLCLSNCWFSSFALFLLHSDFFLSLRLHSVSTPLQCWGKNFQTKNCSHQKKFGEKNILWPKIFFDKIFFSDYKVFWTKKFFRLKMFSDLNFFRPKFFGPTFFPIQNFHNPNYFPTQNVLGPKIFGAQNFSNPKIFGDIKFLSDPRAQVVKRRPYLKQYISA